MKNTLTKSKHLKILMLSLFLCSSVFVNASIAQQQISIKKNSLSLKQAVELIESETEYTFFYKSEDLNMNISKNIHIEGSIEEILKSVFSNTGIVYQIKDKEILLQKESLTPKVQQAVNKKRMIKGQVADASGEPIIGASVIEEGTTNGSLTDLDGNYTLNVGRDKITIKYIGYKTQVIKLSEDAEVYNITLIEDNQLLEEVVVVGYGTQKKVNLTGSVASLSTESIKDRVQTDVLSAVQGTVPGVTIISRPGETPSINFRGRGNLGASEPLYIIDGMVSDATFFSNMDPNSVESISFLKDAASSAIYGSRAAYGVVLVTTKEGKENKLSVNYSGHVGMKMANYLPKIVGSPEYAEMLNEAKYNNDPSAGKNQAYTQEEIGWFKDGSKPDYYPNTDWIDLILDKNVVVTQHSLNFSGGSSKVRYFTGLGYMYEDNHMPNRDKQRYNLNMNISSDLTNWLTLKAGVKFIKVQNDARSGSPNGIDLLVVGPTMVAKQSNGEWGSFSGGKQATQTYINDNPLRKLNEANWSKANNEYTMYDLGFDIKPLKGLIIGGQGSYKRHETKRKDYTALRESVKHFETGQPITGTQRALNSMAMNWGSGSTLLTTLTANYGITLGKHDISALFGTSYEDYKYEKLTAGRKNFPTDLLEDLNVGSNAGTDISNEGGMESNKMFSYFGRINYAFDSRYLLEFNMRADASSRFHKDKRWGYFPSVSGAWRISEEVFMKDQRTWLDNLKIRASWGKLGNINNVGNYDYFMKYGLNNHYSFDDTASMGIIESKIANPNLSWEKVTLTDIGLDLDILGGKLSIAADYYIKNTSDILLKYNVPLETGISNAPSQNIAEVRNKGFEMAITHRHKIGEVAYSIGGNIATNNNKIINLSGSDNMITGKYILKEGESIGSYFGYQTDGLYTQEEIDAGHYYVVARKPQAGDLKYVVQRDNVAWGSSITSDDRVVLGKDVPDFTYGINMSVNWRNFELSAFGQGVSGTKVAFESEQLWPFFLNASPREFHRNRWTEDNPNPKARTPRMYGGTSKDTYNQEISDNNLFDADYFRIKTLSLGYMVPRKVTNRIGLQALKFFVTGENLVTIRADKVMKDFDPEAASGRGIGSFGSKSIAFGLNVSF